MINDYLLYVTLAFTVTAIPGPAVILTIKNSVRHGFKISVAGILGNFIAMVVMATISVLGLGAIILASSTLFSAVKIMGGLYLIYLGIRAWRAPLTENSETQLTAPQGKKEFISVLKEGIWVGISNPKAIAFFTALFPHFIDPTRSCIPQFLTLIFTIEGISTLVLMSYALLSSKAAHYLCQERFMKLFHKLTGAAFIGFGLTLLYEK